MTLDDSIFEKIPDQKSVSEQLEEIGFTEYPAAADQPPLFNVDTLEQAKRLQSALTRLMTDCSDIQHKQAYGQRWCQHPMLRDAVANITAIHWVLSDLIEMTGDQPEMLPPELVDPYGAA